MSKQKFNDDCKGCQPVILDANTMRPFPDDSPPMKAMKRAWERTTLEQRAAYHDVMCLNSRNRVKLEAVQEIMNMLKEEGP